MKITVTNSALEWFRQELGLTPGDALRFYAKYGGTSRFHPGFSVGITVEKPSQVAASVERDGITFFIRESDVWLFNEGNVNVDYDKEQDEVVYDIA
jgi:uncharacterized protein YneR